MTIPKYVSPSSIRRALKILKNADYIKNPFVNGELLVFILEVPAELTMPKKTIKKSKLKPSI